MDINDVNISHPTKLLFPDTGITKKDLAQYYYKIAKHLLPYVRERPLTFLRFTAGIEEKGFFNKKVPEYFPEHIERIEVPLHSKPGESIKMAVADEIADLVYFAGQDIIELHIGLSTTRSLEKPDQIIFDLDPSDDDFEKIRKSAFALKDLLKEYKITSFVKTTGSRGVHVHVPLKVDQKFDEVKSVAKDIAKRLNQRIPDLTTLEHRKKNRGNKVFIDYLRNDYGMTAIAPYSLRALKRAPIATPITWMELRNTSLGPQSFILSNIFQKLEQSEDPWKRFNYHRVKLTSLKEYFQI